jgi:hypothetical protein
VSIFFNLPRTKPKIRGFSYGDDENHCPFPDAPDHDTCIEWKLAFDKEEEEDDETITVVFRGEMPARFHAKLSVNYVTPAPDQPNIRVATGGDEDVVIDAADGSLLIAVSTWPGDRFELCYDGYLVTISRALTHEQRISFNSDILDGALENKIQCGEVEDDEDEDEDEDEDDVDQWEMDL